MLAHLLQNLVTRHGGTHYDFAKAVAITPSTLSHLLNSDPRYRLGVVPCLRIAQVTRSSPTTLLEAAGRADIAVLLADLYGRRSEKLDPLDRRLLHHLRMLDLRTQRAFELLILRATVSGRTEADRSRRPRARVRATG